MFIADTVHPFPTRKPNRIIYEYITLLPLPFSPFSAEMCRLFLLFLLFLSTSASDFFDFDWDSPYESTEDVRYLGRDDGRTPSERGEPHPSTQAQMNERFKEDMLAVLQKRSRAHFDDLAHYFNPKIQIQSCFASGKNLNADQLYQLMIHLSAYYRVWSVSFCTW